jgi:hypothetical protein
MIPEWIPISGTLLVSALATIGLGPITSALLVIRRPGKAAARA